MRDHRSLEAWRTANRVLHLVIDFQEHYWKPAARCLFEQLARSALLTQINIAEGYALRSPGKVRYHLEAAYGQAVETADMLDVLMVRRWAPKGELDEAIAHCQQTQAQILGLIKSQRVA
jgi:four helix bundle protein